MEKNYWIVNPVVDSLLFIFPPLFIIPLILFLKTRISIETLGLIVMGIGGLGHHLPGMIRAYTDPVLFKRFKTRFIAAPIFLTVVCITFSAKGWNGLNFLLVCWGSWHAAMQVNGFLRIYDAKIGSTARKTAWLDWAMCLSWFSLAIFHSPEKLTSLFGHFYGSGGFFLNPETIHNIQILWAGFTGIVTVLYSVNVVMGFKNGTAPNPLKIMSMVVSFSFWWFCMVTVDNLVFGILMWEIFHDIQYNAIVWVYNLQRVKKGITSSPVEKFLFQPRLKKVLIYLGLVFLYGFAGVFTSYIDIHSPSEMLNKDTFGAILTKMTLISAFLHFYFDGFIWKVRDSSFRRGLGLDTEKNEVQSAVTVLPLVHLLKWCLFVIPILYFGINEMGNRAFLKNQYTQLAITIPESWKANMLAGAQHLQGNQLDSALIFFNQAINLKPQLALPYKSVGQIYESQGDSLNAKNYFRKFDMLSGHK